MRDVLIMSAVDDLEAAWDELHDVVPPGWVVGRPMLRDELHVWE